MAAMEPVVIREDEAFPFGGYGRVQARDLIVGDGVRFAALVGASGIVPFGPCWLVVAAQLADGKAQVVLADRDQHVAEVFADAFGRPIEGMSADSGLHVRELPADEPVWIRL